jgi:hypothetical protein
MGRPIAAVGDRTAGGSQGSALDLRDPTEISRLQGQRHSWHATCVGSCARSVGREKKALWEETKHPTYGDLANENAFGFSGLGDTRYRSLRT